MSLHEYRAKNKSNKNINLRHTTRPPPPTATLYNQANVETLQYAATARQEYSPGLSPVSLPSFRESFPEDLCGPSSLARYSRPINSSALPPILSVLNLPTATFAWPPIKPASKMLVEPCLYMDMGVRGALSPIHTPSRSHHPGNYHPSVAGASDITPSSPRESWKSFTSIEVESCSLTSNNHPCSIHCGCRTVTPPRTQQRDTHPSHPERETRLCTSGVLRTPRSKRPPTSKNGHRHVNRVPPPSDDWQGLAQEAKDTDGVTYYVCLGEKDGIRCTYWAMKQAMKRHVEATHLHIKRHSCSYCPKAYSQKTALQVHEATHTGAMPLECHYKCGKMFSDPARRHKHHVNAHGYIPKQSNKKLRGIGVPQSRHMHGVNVDQPRIQAKSQSNNDDAAFINFTR